jgi:hypothetical protein
VSIIREEAGRHFDPVLVEIFLTLEAEFREISRTCMDPCEAPATPGTASAGAECEMSIDERITMIEAALDQCGGGPPLAESPELPMSFVRVPEVDLSTIKGELKDVAQNV